MTQVDVFERRFPESGIVARMTPQTGWGVFAEKDFAAGDHLFRMVVKEDNEYSHMRRFIDSFNDAYDHCITVVPGWVFCPTPEHPLWNVNHSCDANAGFVNWGQIVDGAMNFVAHRPIRAGEQITLEYCLITPYYDGTPQGDGWSMTPCLCGQPNCRVTITGFDLYPRDLQLKAIIGPGEPHGGVIAHIMNDIPELVEILKRENPTRYQEFLTVLDSQRQLSAYLDVNHA